MTLHIREAARHVALITIDNQSKRNALSRAAMGELAEAWERLGASENCRCIVITGAGDKAFCSGADIGGDLSAPEETGRLIDRALLKAKAYTKPIVAAVNGDCAGGGVELLLSTDIRLAAEHARFGLPEVKWSIYPFGGATVKLAHQVGYVHAMDLLLTGRLVTAAFAASINLINRVLPASDVLGASIESASVIAANSPSAVQAVKTQISAGIADYAASREALEQELGDRVRASPHFAEGISAFREKRQPKYG
ncbi:MAG: enoyl-CoA hydratase/isomerase family protein [Hyphomicrobiaceae bacterium]